MNNKKNKQKNQIISSFFKPKPLTYSKSATTTQRAVSNPVQAILAQKVLADSTNTPPKKKKAKYVHTPVNPVVFETESSSLVRRLSSEIGNHSPLSITC